MPGERCALTLDRKCDTCSGSRVVKSSGVSVQSGMRTLPTRARRSTSTPVTAPRTAGCHASRVLSLSSRGPWRRLMQVSAPMEILYRMKAFETQSVSCTARRACHHSTPVNARSGRAAELKLLTTRFHSARNTKHAPLKLLVHPNLTTSTNAR